MELDGFGVHFLGAGLAGYEAGGEDHGDEGQSDEQIVHLSFSLCRGLLPLPS